MRLPSLHSLPLNPLTHLRQVPLTTWHSLSRQFAGQGMEQFTP